MPGSSERPTPPPLPTASQVPAELRELKRWIGWRASWDPTKEKWRKPPHSPTTGEAIGATDKYESHWVTLEKALVATGKFALDGVGFVFKDGDGFVGIDFDDCREAEKLHPDVVNWLRWFPTYVEVSPSGTGVHAICRGRLRKALTATPLSQEGTAKVEIYDRGRYFTVTGQRVSDFDTIANCQTGLEKLLTAVGAGSLPDEGDPAERPMSRLTARKIHETNLEALRRAQQGEGNALLNSCSFFAARAFAAKALEGSEASIKQQLRDIVIREWSSPHPQPGADQTIDSGWSSGLDKPLLIGEPDFPEVSETVEEFNKDNFVTYMGNDVRVGSLEPNRVIGKGESLELICRKVFAFKIRHDNAKIMVGTNDDGSPKLRGKASVWLEHKHRRTYDSVVFEPNQATPANILNLWRGMAFIPKKGDCQRYLDHVFENVCQGDQIKYDYTLRWMANAVRFPAEPGFAAIAVQGLKGVGKNVFAEAFINLWGQHGIIISDQARLTNNFNAHLRDKCAILADEALFAGDRRHGGILKALITGPTITIEAKGIDVTTVRNMLHVMIIGNEQRMIDATADERRYLMLTCGDKQRGNTGYFKALHEQLTHGGYEALLHNLLFEVNLAGFDVRTVPHTKELFSQMAHNLRDADAAWFECLMTGCAPGRIVKDGQVEMRSVDFIDWARQKSSKWNMITVNNVGLLFGKNPRGSVNGFNFQKPQSLAAQGSRRRFWLIPSLDQARKEWNKIRFPVEWPDDGGEWDTFEEPKF